MCRLFGTLSLDPIDASRLTINAPCSLLEQSRVDKKRLQGDGWGIGWFQKDRPQIIKSPLPIYQDLATLNHAITQPEGNVLVGHVRWASNPLKLPREELIGLNHTQPFSEGSWLFQRCSIQYSVTAPKIQYTKVFTSFWMTRSSLPLYKASHSSGDQEEHMEALQANFQQHSTCYRTPGPTCCKHQWVPLTNCMAEAIFDQAAAAKTGGLGIY